MKASGHNILREFCKVRNTSRATKQSTHETPRAMFIRQTLDGMGIEYNVDVFVSVGSSLLSNIEVFFDMGTDNTIMFMAHHDVNNVNSDNCQDNSASVANLLDLANRIKEGKTFDRNVAIVFTDCEEFGHLGADRLSDKINQNEFKKVDYVVNLELTANGNEIWCDHDETPLVDKLEEVVCDDLLQSLYVSNTPPNDSVSLRENKIDSVCIGSLTTDEMQQVYKTGFCNTWGLCHKKNDSFQNADRESMTDFVELLIKLI